MKPPREPSKKTTKGGGLSGLLRALFGPTLRWISLPVVAALALAAGCYLLWQQVRDQVVTSPAYRVTRQSIVLTKVPEWIHTDIADEVLHQMNLNATPSSLLDDELCERLAKAFTLHPWIARVVRVEKRYPARVIVDVQYRRPVAMVEVPMGGAELPGDQQPMAVTGNGGLYPVDAAGVLLPTADFSPAEAKRYPRLGEIHSLPIGPVGTNWGDPRVTGGAEIAATLMADWEKLRLARIIPSEQPQVGGSIDDYSFEILTRDGARVLWGQRPSSAFGSEVSAADKLDRLRTHLPQSALPATNTAAIEVDIRYAQGVRTAPRTARADGSPR